MQILKEVEFPFMEEVETPPNVVRLAQYPDRKGSDDWLRKLPICTEFLSRMGMGSYELDEYTILEKSQHCVQLLRGNNLDHTTWVISKEFSDNNILVEVLHYGRSDTP